VQNTVNVISPARLLPHQTNRLFLTDGGIETSLIFDDGIDLPHFAAFDLLQRVDGRAALERYYARYLAIAADGRFGFVLESPTWRSSPDWAARLGYSEAALAAANADAIELMQGLRAVHERPKTPIVISGCVGPRGDGYVAGAQMAVDEAQAYHAPQIRAMAGAGCDVISAITMTNVPEAIGIVRAAQRAGVPCVIAFTVETDGRLPSGATLEAAIAEVDAATGRGPAYYMINCAHPTHFERLLDGRAAWTRRIGGLRANASCKSHVELNESPELDRGNPIALAGEYAAILERLPHLRVFGGCCGTDHEHIGAIAAMLQARMSTRI
jgi:S-methylmethionine-dependent homocysteine/selenocysteine methylase